MLPWPMGSWGIIEMKMGSAVQAEPTSLRQISQRRAALSDIMDQHELRRLEDLCIQEWAPWCTATCPVHVDVRAMTAAVAKGDFQAAAKFFVKSVPFPRIISRVCDHPCESAL